MYLNEKSGIRKMAIVPKIICSLKIFLIIIPMEKNTSRIVWNFPTLF